jgi:hypothetical protein
MFCFSHGKTWHSCGAVVLLMLAASCKVYDSGLVSQSLDPARQQPDAAVVTGESPVTSRAPSDDIDAETDAGPTEQRASCGDGVVSRGEACDIAIAAGAAGACPTGCSGGQGCTQYSLAGSACTTHCVGQQVTERKAEDGCCPAGADWSADHDCEPRCGNGVIEAGERCDPQAECPVASACTSADSCVLARYTGAAASCNARCEQVKIESCISGDGCCAAGCNSASDSDCTAPAPTGELQTPDASCAVGAKLSNCQACECEHCGQARAACRTDADPDLASKCSVVVNCAEEEECDPQYCYCGEVSDQTCERKAYGPCIAVMERAAGGQGFARVNAQGANNSSPLGRAVSLMECRQAYCAAQCGL